MTDWERAVMHCHIAEAMRWSRSDYPPGPLCVSKEIFMTAMWILGDTY